MAINHPSGASARLLNGPLLESTVRNRRERLTGTKSKQSGRDCDIETDQDDRSEDRCSKTCDDRPLEADRNQTPRSKPERPHRRWPAELPWHDSSVIHATGSFRGFPHFGCSNRRDPTSNCRSAQTTSPPRLARAQLRDGTLEEARRGAAEARKRNESPEGDPGEDLELRRLTRRQPSRPGCFQLRTSGRCDFRGET